MWRKFYLPILAVIIAFIGLTATYSSAEYVCGDANSDSAINVSDAVYIINYVFIGGPAPAPGCCETNCPPIMTDIDGNNYFTVKIGDQCWMAQNLKVTHYRNGDPIPNVTDNGAWYNLITGAYCDYDNDPANSATYGRIYNWYAVQDSRNIAPEGWHVASDTEWKQLEMCIGMSQVEADAIGWRGTDEGGKLKESDTAHWQSPNAGATNESGFTVLPGGCRFFNGTFFNMGLNADFWSSSPSGSSEAWSRRLAYDNSQIDRGSGSRLYGFLVRCIKD